MSIEPGVLDANVLVYSVQMPAPQHAASVALIEAANDPATTLYLTSRGLCEFYAVVTNPRESPLRFPRRCRRGYLGSPRDAWHAHALHTRASRSGVGGLAASVVQ